MNKTCKLVGDGTIQKHEYRLVEKDLKMEKGTLTGAELYTFYCIHCLEIQEVEVTE